MEHLEKLLSKLELVWGFVGAGLVGASLQLLRTPEATRSRRACEALSAIVVSIICGLVATEYLPNRPSLVIAACLAASLSGSKIIDWLQDKGISSVMDGVIYRIFGNKEAGGDNTNTNTVNVNVTPTEKSTKTSETESKIIKH